MAPSKKKPKISKDVSSREVKQAQSPDTIMQSSPTWIFSQCDEDGPWGISKGRMCDCFWDTLLPRMKDFEKTTWSNIFINDKKHNHGIYVDTLNKCAIDRLAELKIELGAIKSLSVNGTVRLYGYLSGPSFVVLWYDDNHGDNDTCVCRSNLKYT